LAGGKHHHAGLGEHRPARQFETLFVQRVPRIVPPQDAMPILLKAKPSTSKRPRRLKADRRHRAGGRSDQGREGLDQGRRQSRRTVGRKGFQIAGRAGVLQGQHDDVSRGNAIYRRETFDNYPAARAIMSCVYEGLQLPIDAALRVESRYFTQILRSQGSAAMIRSLFLSMQELNKGARRPQNVPPTKVKKARRDRARLHGRQRRLRLGAAPAST